MSECGIADNMDMHQLANQLEQAQEINRKLNDRNMEYGQVIEGLVEENERLRKTGQLLYESIKYRSSVPITAANRDSIDAWEALINPCTCNAKPEPMGDGRRGIWHDYSCPRYDGDHPEVVKKEDEELTDNRIDNIEIICQNCHTQTETYTGRNMKKRREKQVHKGGDK